MPENNGDKVIVSMERYNELMLKAHHYDNIKRAAFVGAKLNSWNNEISLDTGAVKDYLMIVEMGYATLTKNELLLAKEAQEAQAAKEASEAE